MQRVEVEPTSNPSDIESIKKAITAGTCESVTLSSSSCSPLMSWMSTLNFLLRFLLPYRTIAKSGELQDDQASSNCSYSSFEPHVWGSSPLGSLPRTCLHDKRVHADSQRDQAWMAGCVLHSISFRCICASDANEPNLVQTCAVELAPHYYKQKDINVEKKWTSIFFLSFNRRAWPGRHCRHTSFRTKVSEREIPLSRSLYVNMYSNATDTVIAGHDFNSALLRTERFELSSYHNIAFSNAVSPLAFFWIRSPLA